MLKGLRETRVLVEKNKEEKMGLCVEESVCTNVEEEDIVVAKTYLVEGMDKEVEDVALKVEEMNNDIIEVV